MEKSQLQQLIESQGPFAGFLTILFNYRSADETVYSLSARFLDRLGRKYGGFHGLWFAETCKSAGRNQGNLHLHLLIKPLTTRGGFEIDRSNFAAVVNERVIQKVTAKLKDDRKRDVLNVKAVSVWNDAGIAAYLIKDRDMRKEEFDHYWGFMTRNKLEDFRVDRSRYYMDAVHGLY